MAPGHLRFKDTLNFKYYLNPKESVSRTLCTRVMHMYLTCQSMFIGKTLSDGGTT